MWIGLGMSGSTPAMKTPRTTARVRWRCPREELVELGGKLDGVETVFKEDRAGRQAPSGEARRASVAYWLLLGGLGLALLLVFLFWPWEYCRTARG